MSTEQKSTAETLNEAVNTFIAREELKYGSKLSKRAITTNFLADDLEPSTLSRWTNPGTHKNWMIPTFRIQNAADVLAQGADREQLRNELMTARLAELSEDEKNEAVVMATWIAGLMAPTADEATLLKVFNQAVGEYPNRLLDNKETLAEFKDFFESKMKTLMDDFWAEREAERDMDPEVTSAAVSRLKAKEAPKPSDSKFFKLDQEKRLDDFGARYQVDKIIKDIQRSLGIKPAAKKKLVNRD